MSPKTLAAVLSAVFTVAIFHAHLSITTAGLTVSLYVPVVLAVALALTTAAALVLAVRAVTRFRSSPYPRTA